MLNNRMARAAFLISFAGHCLFLGAPALNLRLSSHEKKPEEMTIDVEIEKTGLLPKIDIVGEEKKFKEVDSQREAPRLQRVSFSQHKMLQLQPVAAAPCADPDEMLRYQDIVKQRIESCRRYPRWAKERGAEGVVCVAFTLLSNGMAQDIDIIRSSGSDILDKEAVLTVKRASPFHPIPEEFNRSSFLMEVALVFKLE